MTIEIVAEEPSPAVSWAQAHTLSIHFFRVHITRELHFYCISTVFYL